ncbi:hypothetical protein CR513_50618, partial [Mucuna pruriens]
TFSILLKLKSNFNYERKLRYDTLSVKCPRSFALFLKKCGIISHYTMSIEPRMNRSHFKETLKSTITHMHIWGSPIEVRSYRPHKVLQSHYKILLLDGKCKVLEEVEFKEEGNIRNVVFEEEHVIDNEKVFVLIIDQEENEISNDYVVFPQEHENNIDLIEEDSINFNQSMQSSNSQKWIDAMNDEIK